MSSPPTTAEDGSLPQPFLPAELSEIQDKDCIDMAKRLVRKDVTVPREVSVTPIATSFAGSKPEVQPHTTTTPQSHKHKNTQTTRRMQEPTNTTTPHNLNPGPHKSQNPTTNPIVMLHGFDSSSLEFRRLLPKLEAAGAEAYAVDVLGSET